eukprot:evm.model.scf_1951EXC.2 EVM.evm.TU.scf_1951EXC.2   scf_1951EXC:7350-8248(+)
MAAGASQGQQALDPSRIAQEKEKERRKDVEEKGKRSRERGVPHSAKPSVHSQPKRDPKAKPKASRVSCCLLASCPDCFAGLCCQPATLDGFCWWISSSPAW